jgi:hypothetical protein
LDVVVVGNEDASKPPAVLVGFLFPVIVGEERNENDEVADGAGGIGDGIEVDANEVRDSIFCSAGSEALSSDKRSGVSTLACFLSAGDGNKSFRPAVECAATVASALAVIDDAGGALRLLVRSPDVSTLVLFGVVAGALC